MKFLSKLKQNRIKFEDSGSGQYVYVDTKYSSQLAKLGIPNKEAAIGDETELDGKKARVIDTIDKDVALVQVEESLDNDKRQKMAKNMYKKSWEQLDDRQRQTIIKLIKKLDK